MHDLETIIARNNAIAWKEGDRVRHKHFEHCKAGTVTALQDYVAHVRWDHEPHTQSRCYAFNLEALPAPVEIDPRAAGFNYSTGWGSEPKPPIYSDALALQERLAEIANQWSNAEWSLTHALRDVRLASNDVEKAMAVNALASAFWDAQQFWNTYAPFQQAIATAKSLQPDTPTTKPETVRTGSGSFDNLEAIGKWEFELGDRVNTKPNTPPFGTVEARRVKDGKRVYFVRWDTGTGCRVAWRADELVRV